MPNMMDYQQEQHINWKVTFLVIIGVLFICLVVFGILSYNTELEKRILETDTVIAKEVLGQIIQEVKDASYFIAEHPMIQEWQVSPTLVNDHDILIVLNTIKYMLDASIVYIMDTNGTVLVCTPYDDNQTLTGKNYKFRPYFQKAMKGQGSVYPALGITTHKRGLYFSTPIYLKNNSQPVGVAVIKLGLGRFDEILRNYGEGTISGLISPQGIVFSSTENSWLFKSGEKLTTKERESIIATRQFADKPLEPLGLYLSESRVKFNNESYLLVKNDISIPGWQIFALSKTSDIHPVPPFIMSGILLVIFGISYIILAIVYGKEKKQQKEKK